MACLGLRLARHAIQHAPPFRQAAQQRGMLLQNGKDLAAGRVLDFGNRGMSGIQPNSKPLLTGRYGVQLGVEALTQLLEGLRRGPSLLGSDGLQTVHSVVPLGKLALQPSNLGSRDAGPLFGRGPICRLPGAL